MPSGPWKGCVRYPRRPSRGSDRRDTVEGSQRFPRWYGGGEARRPSEPGDPTRWKATIVPQNAPWRRNHASPSCENPEREYLGLTNTYEQPLRPSFVKSRKPRVVFIHELGIVAVLTIRYIHTPDVRTGDGRQRHGPRRAIVAGRTRPRLFSYRGFRTSLASIRYFQGVKYGR